MTLSGIYLIYGRIFTKNLQSFPDSLEEVILKKDYQRIFDTTFHGIIDADKCVGILNDRNGVSLLKIETGNVGNFSSLSFSTNYAHGLFPPVDFKFEVKSITEHPEHEYVGAWRKKVDKKYISGFSSMFLLPQPISHFNVNSIYISQEKLSRWRDFLGEEPQSEPKGVL